MPAPRRGSIDSYSGLGRAQELGQEIHQKIQAQRLLQNPSYRAEVLISHSFQRQNYPVLKEALSRGQRVLYVTPKNSQHSVAEDAMERLQQKAAEKGSEKGASLKAMTLTAKSKMCFKNEPLCNPSFCEFAKDHYTKVAENKLSEQLSKKKNLTARVFKKMAETHEVCPFELQLVAAQEADVLICDYNYAFAPRSSLERLNTIEIDQSGKPSLVIDEAHNLPARAMDYYSPSLSVQSFERMREDVQRLPTHFRKEAHAQIDSCISIIQSCAPPNCSKPCKIKPPVANFFAQDAELRAFLSAYLNSDAQIENKDVVLRMCFYWSEFTQALDFVTDEHKEFFTSFVPFPAQIKITCCDASEILKNCYDDYSQVVGFSATLKPFDYYIRLSGLEGCNPKTAEFASPFARSQRKLLIIPQISSKYSERERNYPRIADTIRRIASLRRENYFAFFPSFEFLGRVFEIFQPLEGFEVFRQTSGMHRDAIENVLERLKLVGGANIIFAVQGGVFSEGIDYTGDMAIGAFVVGPPLPNFDLIREEMRRFYQENYQQGFDYAYTYPAMAKAVQAAGRVIRSETDRGLIVLMDSRFTHGSYSKSMPQDWFDKSPLELVSQKILSDIEDFWRQAPEAHDAR